MNTRFKKGQIPWNKDLKGIHLSPASEFNKGLIPWNKGQKGLQRAWNKGIEYNQIKNEKHHNWRGNKVGYSAIHAWIRRKLGRPLECSHCWKTGGTTYNYHWASLTKIPTRNLLDWKRLCVSCHKLFDLGKIKVQCGR